MKSDTILRFDAVPESEKRFTIKRTAFNRAVEMGIIKIYDIFQIEQRWIIKTDRCRGRIRKTTFVQHTPKEKPFKYEHTVKHKIEKGLDYEITTELEKEVYDLLSKVYSDVKLDSKTRFYIADYSDVGFSDKYVITVDFPDDKPEICYVEFEAKKGNVEDKAFKKPVWIQEEVNG